VAIRNVSEGAARDIEFEFSTPIESSNGFVISDLPYFKYWLDYLSPNGEITCYWDELDSLLPFPEALFDSRTASTSPRGTGTSQGTCTRASGG
jgi:hypothetical protein